MQSFTPRTKIVCTIGPASESPEMIRALIHHGMNVARLNFSHGTHLEHERKLRTIRDISRDMGVPVAILQDLAGPKIRVGHVPDPGVVLEEGEALTLTTGVKEGPGRRVSVTYPFLDRDVKAGDRILIADGLMEVNVTEVREGEILCRVVRGGVLTSHKGLNLPSGTIKTPSLTDKDAEDLRFGLAHDVDYVGISFVRRAEDIRAVKERIRQAGKNTPVIAKIEKHEAIEHMEELMAIADGIMVARGDLGVEIPFAEVPMIQKTLINKANMLGKPVITATQMLRSMVDSPRPTRAEATDVANAVLDGTDAIMLSEETAMGKYPVEAVAAMAEIALSAERRFPHEKYLSMTPAKEVSESVAHASCVLAEHLNAGAIIANTQSGLTAAHISRFRPRSVVIALSPTAGIVRRLCLVWGCLPRLISPPADTDDMIETAAAYALASGHVTGGDLAVITAGHPVGGPGHHEHDSRQEVGGYTGVSGMWGV